MKQEDNIFYKPRKFNTIELWKDVTEEQWQDAGWQLKNSIRTVEQLKKLIKLKPNVLFRLIFKIIVGLDHKARYKLSFARFLQEAIHHYKFK